jgi:hypothetical protein
MKKFQFLQVAALCAVAGMAMVSSAKASMALTMADYGVGWSNPSATPPGQADMLNYANTMVTLFNSVNPDGYTTTITIPNANDGSGSNHDQFSATIDRGSAVSGPLSMASVISPNNGVTGGPSSYSIDLGKGGFGYLIAGWDGSQGADQIYYVGGLSGIVTISNSELPQNFQKGLSNFWLTSAGDGPVPPYSSVPEPATLVAGALLLLPLGVSAVRILRRKNQV